MKKNIPCLFIVLAISISCIACENCLEIEKKIGQMILVGFEGDSVGSEGYQKVYSDLKSGNVGGVIFFEKNIKDKKTLSQMTSQIAELKNKPLISIDQEGGFVQRLNEKNGSKKYPSAYKLALGNTKDAYNTYNAMSKELKGMHFNYNFGPCVDLLVNPDSIITKKERGYSSDVKTVVEFAKTFIDAHYKNGIITSLKHFPGHGSPKGDTHLGFVDASKTWNENELMPYVSLMNSNPLQTVMISHIFIDKLDSEKPAVLSAPVITGLLREKMGYNGVVITDDLDMGAIKNNYSLEEIVVGSINAGADILLFSNFKSEDADPELVKKIHKIVLRAVSDKRIPRSKIDESYRRIQELKTQL